MSRGMWQRAATAVAVIGILLTAAATLVFGTYDITLDRVWQTLTGGGSPMDRQIILEQRLPRLLAALVVGAGLGAAGAVFQTLSRNPLGSPDILGFTTGSATGALIVSLVLPGMRSGEAGAEAGGLGIGVGAVLGGFLTAAVALLSSVNDYLLTSADLEEAESAKTWLYGSLNALRWPDLTGPGPAILLLLFALLLGRRQLRMLELGEDMAGGLGVPVRRTSRVLMMLAVGITAAAIAVAGPIGFLALAAPQLAHRWWRTAGLTVGTSALLGAGILAVADFLAARLLSPFEIPVGLVTGALGGVYLLSLLHRERERL